MMDSIQFQEAFTFPILRNLLLSIRGEVGDPDNAETATEGSEGTATVDDPFDPAFHHQNDAEQDTGQETEGDETQVEAQANIQEESFLQGSELDPRKLPPEMQPIFKRMQGVYTKKMQGISELRSKADVVDRFYADQNFARQTLVTWAAQNGYQLQPIGAQPEGAQPQTPRAAQNGASPALLEMAKQRLGPELNWFAEPAADMVQTLVQEEVRRILTPIQQAQMEAQQRTLTDEYNKHADELSQIAPGWEEHEEAMADMLDFLKSDKLHHPKYGSKHQLLYDLATAKAASIAQATQRINAAAKNRPSSGRTAARPVVKVEDEVMKAKTPDDAFEIAKRYALQQVRARG